MFTGIIEATGKILAVEESEGNRIFTIASPISSELEVDQSVSHDGVCLTVVHHNADAHRVVAVRETLENSTLSGWQVGCTLNLERAMAIGALLDGHLVQGHVDGIGACLRMEPTGGSHALTFGYPSQFRNLLVQKGSVCINGVSLTVVDPTDDDFRVAVIPHTQAFTNFKQLKQGQEVNLEFDIIGKYVSRIADGHVHQ